MALASVVCAMQKLKHLLHPSPSKFLFPISEIQSIQRELYYLKLALENDIYLETGSNLREDPLEQQIEDAVDKLDDLLESHRVFSESRNSQDEITDYDLLFSQQLLQLKQEITSLIEKVKNTDLSNSQEVRQGPAGEVFTAHNGAVSSMPGCSDEDSCKLVGLEDELSDLLDRVVGGSNKLEIFSIFGMVGVGKTTLARQIYDHPFILSHFDARIFVTLGPTCKLREFLILVLGHIGVDVVERLQQMGNNELKLHLGNYLKNQTYLIVMDDLWHRMLVDVLTLPVKNKSRIILTTRLHDLAAEYATGRIHHKQLMNDNDSWDLLYRIVFTTSEEYCSKNLEKIGRKIAENCEGLPLAIIAIGKLLSKDKTEEYWKKVSEDENPLKIGEDKHSSISKSIYLSYEMLPRVLKTVFLYIGVIPKNFILYASSVNVLWKAEGFLSPQRKISLDQIGEVFLTRLYKVSLVLIARVSITTGRIKTARVHSVFRNLCIAEARREKFCHVIKRYAYNFPQGIDGQPRWCIHNNVVFGIKDVRDAMQASSSLRSLLCFGPYHPYPLQVPLGFPLLKILHATEIRLFKFPLEVLELVRLKYIAITCDELPKLISKLWNLEVLIVQRHYDIRSPDGPAYLPLQIWDLKWLIELRCTGFDLLDPCTNAEGCIDERILEHLQTLSGVSSHSCTQRIFARIPNLTKLGIEIALAPGKVENLSFLGDDAHPLHCLRSFHCRILNPNSQVLPTKPVFLSTIKKLTLSGCRFPWEYMSVISCLPSLEQLKLLQCAFRGRVWTCETEFLELKLLILEDLDIEEWIANSICNPFPKLVGCGIWHCYKLHKLPMNLGNIDTLKYMSVHDCSPLVTTWAKQMQQNHPLKYPNDDLQLRITNCYKLVNDCGPLPKQIQQHHQWEYPNARLRLFIRSSWDDE